MNQTTMNNEQFALWVALSSGIDSKLFERADEILNWLNKDIKKPSTPITPKGK
jgi:uncharacterized protein YgfB (UPF0149 family)